MNDLPGILFDRESIRAFIQPGQRWTVYRLLAADGTLVYAGATGDPRARLLKHLADGKPAVIARLEFFKTSSAMARAEKALLNETTGTLNIRPGQRHGAWKAVRG